MNNKKIIEFAFRVRLTTIVLLLIRAVLAVSVTVAKLRHTDAFSSITCHFAFGAFCCLGVKLQSDSQHSGLRILPKIKFYCG